jgi:hypothetical protein
MKIIETMLFERHLDIVDVLGKYKNDKDVFYQFGDLQKLGINPRYQWSMTPVGIYGYPIITTWKRVLENQFDYGGRSKFINIFKLKPGFNIIYSDKYGSEQYHSDCKKLIVILNKLKKQLSLNDPENLSSKVDDYDYNAVLSELNFTIEDKNHKFIEELLKNINLLRKFSEISKKQTFLNIILRELGYDGIVDYGTGQITSDIPAQAVFLSAKPIQLLESIPNIKKVKLDDKISDDMKDSIIAMHGQDALKINDMSEEEQLERLRRDPLEFKLIKNPSENIKIAAVDLNATNMDYVIKPSVKLQKLFLLRYPYRYFNYSKKISNKVLIDTILKNPEILIDIELHEPMQFYLIKHHPELIKKINLTPNGKIMAVSLHPELLNYLLKGYISDELKKILKLTADKTKKRV